MKLSFSSISELAYYNLNHNFVTLEHFHTNDDPKEFLECKIEGFQITENIIPAAMHPPQFLFLESENIHLVDRYLKLHSRVSVFHSG